MEPNYNYNYNSGSHYDTSLKNHINVSKYILNEFQKAIKKATKYFIIPFCLLFSFCFTSCKKYLDAKPNQSLSVPNKLSDLQSLLDNVSVMNKGTSINNNASDEYYVGKQFWTILPVFIQSTYAWYFDADPNSPSSNPNDWNYLYQAVFYANTVLDNLDRPSIKNDTPEWKNLKGSAHFYRSWAYYQLVLLYAGSYNPESASQDLGIVLREDSDFSKKSNRSTLKQTYEQIIKDLETASLLLNRSNKPFTAEYKTRPTLAAVYGLLAKAYLQIEDYANSEKFSTKSLEEYSELMDFNEIENSGTPFQSFNKEVIFYSKTEGTIIAHPSVSFVDTILYSEYNEKDLRKSLFFIDKGEKLKSFKGSYNGGNILFSGIAVDEIYIMRAEAMVRSGNVTGALKDLNHLLIKRWELGSFTEIVTTDQDELLTKILLERRKELYARGTRWSDLKRLNRDQENAITLTRDIGTSTYTLPPNDLRYTWLIPQQTITESGIQQNKR